MSVVIMMVVMVISPMIMMVGVVLRFVIMVTAPVRVIVRGDGVGNQMEEGVPQQSARGKAEQDLQEGRVVLGIFQRDAEEYEEGGGTDECCGDKGVGPQLP